MAIIIQFTLNKIKKTASISLVKYLTNKSKLKKSIKFKRKYKK